MMNNITRLYGGDASEKMDARSAEKLPYEEFYQQQHRRVLGYLIRKCANREDAEDLTQQVFLYCYQHYDRYDPAKATLNSWLFLIVNSRWKNYLRDRRAHVALDNVVDYLVDENDLLSGAVEMDDLRGALADALRQLPETQRSVVIARYFGGLNTAQVAQKLNISEGNARVLLSRAIDKLGVLLGKEWIT